MKTVKCVISILDLVLSRFTNMIILKLNLYECYVIRPSRTIKSLEIMERISHA